MRRSFRFELCGVDPQNLIILTSSGPRSKKVIIRKVGDLLSFSKIPNRCGGVSENEAHHTKSLCLI